LITENDANNRDIKVSGGNTSDDTRVILPRIERVYDPVKNISVF
jgi:hypothetical protein